MRILSLDLRERTLTSYDEGDGPRDQIARRFSRSGQEPRPREFAAAGSDHQAIPPRIHARNVDAVAGLRTESPRAGSEVPFKRS